MREKKRGYPVVVSIGYGKQKESRNKIKGKKPVIINNTKELEQIGKNEIAWIANIGKKKKLERANKAKEKKKEPKAEIGELRFL